MTVTKMQQIDQRWFHSLQYGAVNGKLTLSKDIAK